MSRPVVIIRASVEPVAVDATAWAIGLFFALGTVGCIGAVTYCLRILAWI